MVDREGLVCHTTFFSPRGTCGKMYYAMIVAHFAGVEKIYKSQCYLGLTNDPNVTTKALIFYPFSRRPKYALNTTEIACLLSLNLL